MQHLFDIDEKFSGNRPEIVRNFSFFYMSINGYYTRDIVDPDELPQDVCGISSAPALLTIQRHSHTAELRVPTCHL